MIILIEIFFHTNRLIEKFGKAINRLHYVDKRKKIQLKFQSNELEFVGITDVVVERKNNNK